jgi:hypothetical protein
MVCFVMADDLVEADYEATRLSLIKLEVDNLRERIKSASVLFDIEDKPKMDEVFELLFETIADVAGNILKQVLENRLDLIEISERLHALQFGQNQVLRELDPEKYKDLGNL